MGYRNQQELGERRPVQRRNGLGDFPGHGGMFLNSEPVSQPPNRPSLLENLRIVGGTYVPRPSVRTFNSEPLHDPLAKIVALTDFQVIAKKLYVSLDGCPGVSTVLGTSINWVDTDDYLPFSAGVYYPSSGTAVMGVFDGRMFIGNDSDLKAFTLIQPAYGQETLFTSGFEQAEAIASFPGFTIRTLCEFDGKLFIGLDAGIGASKVAVWDGTTIHDGTNGTTADLTAIDPPSKMVVWRDKLAMGFSTANLRLRSSGDVPGTWAAAVVIAAFPIIDMVSYRDNLYMVASGVDLKKYDGAAVTTPKTLGAGSFLYALGVAFGFLFYGYQRAAALHAVMGRMDSAAVFLDTHKVFASLETPNSLRVRAIAEYRGSLYAAVINPGGALVMSSNGTDTAGTYVQQNPSGGDANQFLVA